MRYPVQFEVDWEPASGSRGMGESLSIGRGGSGWTALLGGAQDRVWLVKGVPATARLQSHDGGAIPSTGGTASRCATRRAAEARADVGGGEVIVLAETTVLSSPRRRRSSMLLFGVPHRLWDPRAAILFPSRRPHLPEDRCTVEQARLEALGASRDDGGVSFGPPSSWQTACLTDVRWDGARDAVLPDEAPLGLCVLLAKFNVGLLPMRPWRPRTCARPSPSHLPGKANLRLCRKRHPFTRWSCPQMAT